MDTVSGRGIHLPGRLSMPSSFVFEFAVFNVAGDVAHLYSASFMHLVVWGFAIRPFARLRAISEAQSSQPDRRTLSYTGGQELTDSFDS